MPSFTLHWAWLGRQGSVADVDVKWHIRGTLADGRIYGGGSRQRFTATVETVLPVDYTAGGFGRGLVGEGRITCSGELVTDGKMIVEVAPPTTAGETPVRLTIGGDENPEAGVWPPAGPPLPTRRPDDIVAYGGIDEDGNITQNRYVPNFPERDPTYWGKRSWREENEPILREDHPVFSNIPTPSDGAGFPYVIGAPGTTLKPGSPAWWADEATYSDILIIEGYNGVPPGASPTVTIWGPTTSTDDRLVSVTSVPVYTNGSAAGQGYAFVRTSEIATLATAQGVTIFRQADRRYYVSWVDGAARPGGAGSVLQSIIGTSTLRWDVEEWQGIAGLLDRTYTLAGWFDSPEASVDVIESMLLPILPLSIVSGRGGLRPVLDPWWLDAPVSDARTPLLIDGEGLTYAESDYVRASHSPSFSRVSVAYNYRPDTQRHANRKTATTETSPYPLVQPTSVYDRLGSLDIETELVWGPNVATFIAHDRLRRELTPTIRMRFMVTDLDRYGPGGNFLIPGRPIRLTSSRWGITAAPAVISEVEVDPGGMTFEVAIRTDGVRGDLMRTA